MTHARNIWVAIALQAACNHLGWPRQDVAKWVRPDVERMALAGLDA